MSVLEHPVESPPSSRELGDEVLKGDYHPVAAGDDDEGVPSLTRSNRPLDVLRGCDLDNRGCPRTALFVSISYENVRARDSDRGNPLETGVSRQRLSYQELGETELRHLTQDLTDLHLVRRFDADVFHRVNHAEGPAARQRQAPLQRRPCGGRA